MTGPRKLDKVGQRQYNQVAQPDPACIPMPITTPGWPSQGQQDIESASHAWCSLSETSPLSLVPKCLVGVA